MTKHKKVKSPINVAHILQESKVAIIFDAQDYYAKQEVRTILDKDKYLVALNDIYNTARSLLKHNDEGLSDSQREALENIRSLAYVDEG